MVYLLALISDKAKGFFTLLFPQQEPYCFVG